MQHSYATYAGTADIYVFFVELGMRLLRAGGTFFYILPNKWMRAGYGRALRLWAAQYQQTALIDFGDLPVFEEATTYPMLWQMRKAAPAAPPQTASLKTLSFGDGGLGGYLSTHLAPTEPDVLTAESWSLASGGVQQVLAKMRAAGTPLGEYVQGKIYYGIKTGYNEAFVIDAATRARLIAEDARSAEIIKPFLAGRDIKRYQTPVADKYLIAIPKDQSVEGYISVEKHLQKFRNELMKRAGSNAWYHFQALPKDMEKLSEIKIVYPDIALKPNFTLDFNGNYCVNTAYIIPMQDYGLLGFLNSNTF